MRPLVPTVPCIYIMHDLKGNFRKPHLLSGMALPDIVPATIFPVKIMHLCISLRNMSIERKVSYHFYYTSKSCCIKHTAYHTYVCQASTASEDSSNGQCPKV